jgi:acetyltransferase-like isoleucine patch superfamily enzyme
MKIVEFFPLHIQEKIAIYKYKKKNLLKISGNVILENVHLVMNSRSLLSIDDGCILRNCSIILKNSKVELGPETIIENSDIRCVNYQTENGSLQIADHVSIKHFKISNEGRIFIGSRSVLEGALHGLLNAYQNALLQLGEYSILKGCELYVFSNASLIAGDYFGIGDGSEIRACTKVKIGSYVMISYNVTIFDTNTHSTDWQLRRIEIEQSRGIGITTTHIQIASENISIGDDCWVGKDAKILKGTDLGSRSIVGTGVVLPSGNYDPDSLIVNCKPRIIDRSSKDFGSKL